MAQPAGFNTTLVGVFDGAALQALRGDVNGRLKPFWASNNALSAFNGPALLEDNAGTARPLAVAGCVTQGVTTTIEVARTPAVFKDINAVALVAGTGATVWTPAAGKKFRLMGGWFSSSAAAALIFGDNAVGTVIFRTPLLAAAGVFVLPAIGNGFLSAAANNVLKLDVSAGSTVTGCVFGTEE